MTGIDLPPLSPEYEPTRATLHAYARAVGVVARAHGIAHPKWWHVSLAVRPEGLVTEPIPLPGGGALAIGIEVKHHQVVVRASDGRAHTIDFRDRPTAAELGQALIDAAAEHGLDDTYERERFENNEARTYDPSAAGAYFDALTSVAGVFERHRATLGERVGPVRLWPHGFDLAFEWFGTRTEVHDGEPAPAQLNLGFDPGGDRPYLYSNPWPFDEALMQTPLPHGAEWHTDGWRGTLLPYDLLQGDPEAGSKLIEYARVVFDAAKPYLETRQA